MQVLSIVSNKPEVLVIVGAIAMIAQLIATFKALMNDCDINRTLKDIHIELKEIREEMKQMNHMIHGPYHVADFGRPKSLMIIDAPASKSQLISYERPVVAFPNEAQAAVRDLLDDMITSIEHGKDTVTQSMVPYSEWATERNIHTFDATCDEAFADRDRQMILSLIDKKDQ